MKYAYTAVLTPEDNGMVSVDFPDIKGCYTSGNDVADAVYMAQDVLCLALYDMEQDGEPLPEASKPCDIKTLGDQFKSVVAVDTEFYHRFYSNKLVKKTLNIPMWLNEQAVRAGLNFSGILQDALKAQLHIGDGTTNA